MSEKLFNPIGAAIAIEIGERILNNICKQLNIEYVDLDNSLDQQEMDRQGYGING